MAGLVTILVFPMAKSLVYSAGIFGSFKASTRLFMVLEFINTPANDDMSNFSVCNAALILLIVVLCEFAVCTPSALQISDTMNIFSSAGVPVFIDAISCCAQTGNGFNPFDVTVLLSISTKIWPSTSQSATFGANSLWSPAMNGAGDWILSRYKCNF